MPRQKSQEVQRLERQVTAVLRREADTVKSLWEEIYLERAAHEAAIAGWDDVKRQLAILATREIDRSLELAGVESDVGCCLPLYSKRPRVTGIRFL